MADQKIAELEADIRAIQGDLARDLDALTDRLPQPEDLAKVATAAVATAVGAWVTVSWALRRRRRRREERRLQRVVERAVREVTGSGPEQR